jgi:branched-chain amino acid aminotransferase
MKRFVYSASKLNMDLGLSQQQLEQAVLDTIAKNQIKNGYIRPLARYGYGKM